METEQTCVAVGDAETGRNAAGLGLRYAAAIVWLLQEYCSQERVPAIDNDDEINPLTALLPATDHREVTGAK